MRVVRPQYTILTNINNNSILKKIEAAGRTCYKSEEKITDDSAEKFVKMLIKRGHLSVLEHEGFSVRFIFDRGVSHEIVRHRIASFSQESTRYCNYCADKFDKELSVIDVKPHLKNEASYNIWMGAMHFAERAYTEMIAKGERPEIARGVLPNALKTEIVVTANLREWRVIFEQRTAKVAHPQMREVMRPLLTEIKTEIPIIFDDITWEK